MNRRRRRVRRAVWTVLVGALAVTGCWDQREIEERSTILTVTLDRTAEPEGEGQGVGGAAGQTAGPGGEGGRQQGRANSSETSGEGGGAGAAGRLTLGASIAVPGGIPLGNEGGGGGGSGPSPSTTVQTTGRTTMQALDNLEARLNFRPFFGHTRIIAVSDELARDGIWDHLNVFRRHPQIRRLLWLAVIQGEASQVLEFQPELARVPSAFITDMLDDLVQRGRIPNQFLDPFIIRTVNDGEDGMVPYVTMNEKDIRLLGMAVFRDDRMVGSISREEIWSFLQITGEGRASEELTVSVEGYEVGVQITGRESTIQPELVNDKLRMRVEIELEANIRETPSGFDVSDRQALQKVARSVQSRVGRDAEALVQKVQRWGADIFSFGQYVRGMVPKVWDRATWRETFSTLPVQIDVEVLIRRTGMLAE